MKKLLILITLSVLFPQWSKSCLNIVDIDKYLTQNFFICFPTLQQLEGQNSMIESGIRDGNIPFENSSLTDKDSLNTSAVFCIYLNDFSKAKKILEHLIKKYPNDYSVNSNLGTLYELLGENEKALFHIKKSIAIKPDSHVGSEWIHVKILEAKIKYGKNKSRYVDLLGISFGRDSLPKTNIESRELKKIRTQLLYQLKERSYFVKAPDPVMGDLIFLSGDLAFLIHDYTCAKQSYQIAGEYGYINKALLEKRLSAVEQFANDTTESIVKKAPVNLPKKASKNKEQPTDNKRSKFFPIFFSPLLILIIVLAARKRKQKRNK